MVHVQVANASTGEDVVPIFWDDNYVSLLPGEQRGLSAHFEPAGRNNDGLVLTVDGWNVAAANIPIELKW